MVVVSIKHKNAPYAQGYSDAKEGKEFYPHYWSSGSWSSSGVYEATLVHGTALSNYDRGQYTLGWDAAIMGDAF